MVSTGHLFRQSRADIATLLGRGASIGKSKDVLAAMGRYEDSFDEENHGAVAAITNQTPSTPGQHGVPFGKGPSVGPPRSQGAPRGSK